MHNIELFIDKCQFDIGNFSIITNWEKSNLYTLAQDQIGIYGIIILKNKIIQKLNNQLYNGGSDRDDVGLFYYLRYYPNYYPNNRTLFPIVIVLNEIEFYDKLSVLLFECLCYYLSVELKRKVYINCIFKKNILTEEVSVSCVNYLNNNINYSQEKFEKCFNYEIYKNHYRLYLNYEETKDKKRLSILYTDLIIFLKPFDIDERSAEEVAEVVIELVGNACEHAHSDCLFDLDIAQNYSKKNKEGKLSGSYYAINISIVNFSDKLFYHDIKEKIKILSNQNDLSDRYKTLLQSYQNHKKFFNDQYIEDYFYLIAAFQNKISGRIDNNITGGTGLKKLIQSLQRKSDTSMCYMQTGDITFYFVDKYLDYNADNWIGFNSKNDFINEPPSIHIFRKSKIFIPGTAYNLTFVYERKKENE